MTTQSKNFNSTFSSIAIWRHFCPLPFNPVIFSIFLFQSYFVQLLNLDWFIHSLIPYDYPVLCRPEYLCEIIDPSCNLICQRFDHPLNGYRRIQSGDVQIEAKATVKKGQRPDVNLDLTQTGLAYNKRTIHQSRYFFKQQQDNTLTTYLSNHAALPTAPKYATSMYQIYQFCKSFPFSFWQIISWHSKRIEDPRNAKNMEAALTLKRFFKMKFVLKSKIIISNTIFRIRVFWSFLYLPILPD